MKFTKFLGSMMMFGAFGTAQAQPNAMEPMGMSLSLGGGVADFTDDDMQDFTDTAGLWEVRLAAGTRSPFAVEAAYVGTSQSIDAIGLDNDARLASTGFEGAVRGNFMALAAAQPYVIAGVGYKRYELRNVQLNFSSVEDSDEVFELPFGAGMAFRAGQVLMDARGIYRRAFNSDLVGPSDDIPLHNWSATLRAGFEF